MNIIHYLKVERNGADLELTITGEVDVLRGVEYRGCDPAPDATVTAIILDEQTWAGQLTAEEERQAERALVDAWRDGAFDSPGRSYADRGDYEYDRMKDEGR